MSRVTTHKPDDARRGRKDHNLEGDMTESPGGNPTEDQTLTSS